MVFGPSRQRRSRKHGSNEAHSYECNKPGAAHLLGMSLRAGLTRVPVCVFSFQHAASHSSSLRRRTPNRQSQWQSGRLNEARDFASPPRGGFALIDNLVYLLPVLTAARFRGIRQLATFLRADNLNPFALR
jgi:hypothetical protein